ADPRTAEAAHRVPHHFRHWFRSDRHRDLRFAGDESENGHSVAAPETVDGAHRSRGYAHAAFDDRGLDGVRRHVACARDADGHFVCEARAPAARHAATAV